MKKFKCYCISLRRASTKLTNIYNRHLKPTGLSVTQYSLLSAIRDLDTCSVTSLADYIGLERTTLVRTLKPVLKRGLVIDLSGDGERDRQIRLSEEGHSLLTEARGYWAQAQDEINQVIGQDQSNQLLDLLHKLSQL